MFQLPSVQALLKVSTRTWGYDLTVKPSFIYSHRFPLMTGEVEVSKEQYRDLANYFNAYVWGNVSKTLALFLNFNEEEYGSIDQDLKITRYHNAIQFSTSYYQGQVNGTFREIHWGNPPYHSRFLVNLPQDSTVLFWVLNGGNTEEFRKIEGSRWESIDESLRLKWNRFLSENPTQIWEPGIDYILPEKWEKFHDRLSTIIFQVEQVNEALVTSEGEIISTPNKYSVENRLRIIEKTLSLLKESPFPQSYKETEDYDYGDEEDNLYSDYDGAEEDYDYDAEN